MLFNGHPDGRQRLFIALHHLLVDGISWRVLIEDLNEICSALLAEQIRFEPFRSLEHGGRKWIVNGGRRNP